MFYASVQPIQSELPKLPKKTQTNAQNSPKKSYFEDTKQVFFSTSLPSENKLISRINDNFSSTVRQHLERSLSLIKDAEESKSIELFAKAGKRLSKAIFLNPNNDHLYLLKGRCLREVGDFKESLKYYNIANKIDVNNKTQFITSKLDFARSLFDNKIYGEARVLAEDCLEKDPENSRAQLIIIEITAFDDSKNDFDDQIKSFIEKFGETKELLQVLLKRTKTRESLYQSDVFLRMAQQYKETKDLEMRGAENHNLAKRFLLSNKLTYALNQITSAVKLCPMNPQMHVTKGVIDERRGNLAQAGASYLEAYRLSMMGDKEDEAFTCHVNRLLNRLAVRCMKQRFLEEAFDLLNVVIQSSQNYQFYLNRAQCLQMMEEYEMAIEDYNEAIDHVDLKAEAADIKERLSHCYYEFGVKKFERKQYESADEFFTKAIELNGKEDYYLRRSNCRILQKKFELAVEDAVCAVKMMNCQEDCIEEIKFGLPHKLNKNNIKINNICNRLINNK